MFVFFLVAVVGIVSIQARENWQSANDNCRCVFKVGTSALVKLNAMNYVCANSNCTAINSGGNCYYPDTVEAHSAWAINNWYQLYKSDPQSCDFGGAAEVICADCVCTLKTGTTTQQMTDATTFVCTYSNCSAIAPGGSHFLPDTIENHCSWAINEWYQTHNWAPESCDFDKIAQLEPVVCQGR